MIVTHSLPSFLSRAGTNINRPKQLFWYTVGTLDLFLSLLIFFVLLFLAPSHSLAWRTLRLLGVLFGSFGAMQTYSAHMGFCTQVHSRGARQLKAWELGDVEALSMVPSTKLGSPFDVPLTPVTLREPTSTTELVFPPIKSEGDEGAIRPKRPPIFGPETIIADPKVLALQKKMVRDILVVGLVWALLGITVVLCVPGLR